MSLVDNFECQKVVKIYLKKFGIRKSNLKGGDEMQKRKGFTLIELLVVIAIIGLLATIAVIALNSARVSSRDAKRVADVKEVQTGLELYFNEKNSYPDCGTSSVVVLVSSMTGGCALDLTKYIGGIANIKDPLKPGTTACTILKKDCDYGYTDVDAAASFYSIYFYTEAQSGSLGQGSHTATPAGIN